MNVSWGVAMSLSLALVRTSTIQRLPETGKSAAMGFKGYLRNRSKGEKDPQSFSLKAVYKIKYVLLIKKGVTIDRDYSRHFKLIGRCVSGAWKL